MASWGCGTVLSKQALERGVAPLTLLALELGASSLLLSLSAVVLRVRLTRSGALTKLALLGVLNPGAAYALGLLGLLTISASMSILLWATEPALIIVLAVLLLREHIAAATLLALAAALAGVLLVVYRPGATGDAIGVSLTMGAVCACALYTVLTRWLLLDDSSLGVVLVQQIAALLFAITLVATTTVLRESTVGLPADAATWGLALASGSVYYGLAFWFFVGGLRGVPASVAASMYPLIPVFGLIAAFVIGDRLAGQQWLGAALVVLATAAAATLHILREPNRG
jgi:drug/metabolite transporter (DMT)-like permease